VRQFHVKICYEHLRGSSCVMPKESAITFVHHYEINGVWAWPDNAHFRFGPFGEIHLGRSRSGSQTAEEYNRFLDTLTLDDVLGGSNLERGMFVLPVSTLEAVAVVAGGAPLD